MEVRIEMERFLSLKNGLMRIGELKQNLDLNYEDQGRLTGYLEVFLSDREKCLSKKIPVPEHARIEEISNEINKGESMVASGPSFTDAVDIEEEVFVNSRISLPEVLTMSFFALMSFILLITLFVLGIPKLQFSLTSDPDVDYWTIVDFSIFLLPCLTIPTYIYVRRSFSPVLNRRVGFLELIPMSMIFLGTMVAFMALETFWGGILSSFLCLGPGISCLYLVKQSQRSKYESEIVRLLADFNRTRKAEWEWENREEITRLQEIEISIEGKKQELDSLTSKRQQYEDHERNLDSLSECIETTSSELSNVLKLILEREEEIVTIWSGIESMIPRSEKRPF